MTDAWNRARCLVVLTGLAVFSLQGLTAAEEDLDGGWPRSIAAERATVTG